MHLVDGGRWREMASEAFTSGDARSKWRFRLAGSQSNGHPVGDDDDDDDDDGDGDERLRELVLRLPRALTMLPLTMLPLPRLTSWDGLSSVGSSVDPISVDPMLEPSRLREIRIAPGGDERTSTAPSLFGLPSAAPAGR